MCEINKEQEFKRGTIKLFVATTLIVGTLVSDAILRVMIETNDLSNIDIYRAIHFSTVAVSVFSLLILQTKKRIEK